MPRRLLALAVMVTAPVACGRVGFDARIAAAGDGGARDAIGDSEDTGDAGGTRDAAARCDPAQPFGTPVPISELDVAGAYDSTITLAPDELTAWWYSDRAGSAGAFDLYTAARPDLGSPFANITALTAVDSPEIDKEPGIAPDATVLAFVSTRAPADAGGDLFISLPVGTAAVRVANLSSTSTEEHPFFELASSDFYFSSNRAGTFSIYHSTYLGSGAFASPTQVTDLDAAGYNTDDVTVMSGGLVAYLRSDRPGGLGSDDIWRAERASTSDAWGAPVLETEVDSVALDTPSWISPDGCRLYLSSSRTDTSDLYVASRTP